MASVAVGLLDALLAFFYWVVSNEVPWPVPVLPQLVVFGPAVAFVALTSPRRRSS